jgi:virulence factor Mce-like protein
MTRRRRRPDPRRQTLIAAACGALILAALAYTALTAGNGLPLKSYYMLNARFANAAEIDPYSDVRIAGKLVGQVLSSSYSDGAAVVRLQLDPSTGKLRASTSARIRLEGLIGAKYVELTPGATGRWLASGATIPESQTSTTVDVFDVLNTFDAKRQEDLREVLGGLGQGFLGRGAQLNQALHASPGVVGQFGSVAAAVNARTGAAARFVPGVQSLSGAFDPVRDELVSSWDPQAAALEPFTAERGRVQATLTDAPSTLSTVQSGLAQTDPLLQQTAGLSEALTELTGPAPAALREATAMLKAAPGALDRSVALFDTLKRAAAPTLHLLIGAWPLAKPAAEALVDEALPLLSIGHYSCDVNNWAHDWSSLFRLGSPPGSSSGPDGMARSSVALNDASSTGNTPNALDAKYYEAPCAAILDHAG